MADDKHILTTLRKLAVYYGKEPTRAQAQIYLEMLAELEPDALDFAVQAWIRHSPFFPRISELLHTASRYTPEPASPAYHLRKIQYMLERKFTFEGELEAQAWEDLAQRFEFNGLSYSASACRKRFQRYKAPPPRQRTAAHSDGSIAKG